MVEAVTRTAEQRNAFAALILKRYDKLKGDRKTWDVMWQEMAQYILPRRSNILVKRVPGARQTDSLFDSTAPNSNERLASALMGSLTDAANRWFSLKMRDEELNTDPEVAEWLDACATIIYGQLNHSNFNAELHEGYLDIGAFGTMSLLVREGPIRQPRFNGFEFMASPIGSYVVMEDARGMISSVMRKIEMSYEAAAGEFGVGNLHERTAEKAKSRPDEMFDIIHVVMPRGNGYGALATQLPYKSCYIEYETKHLISEGGFHENPYMTSRWAKVSGETYGRGPGYTALPDIRTLNKAVEDKLRAWALTVGPPLKQQDDGVIGRVSLAPFSLTTVRQMDALQPLLTGSRLDLADMEEDKLRHSIRAMFYNDQFMIPEKNYMTAYEVDKQLEVMYRILGPTIGRLTSELLKPLIDRCFGLLLRAGELPPVPESVLMASQMGNGMIDIEYEGPLARAQRGSDLVSIQKAYSLLQPIAQTSPDMLDLPDPDAVARYIWNGAGAPLQLLRDPRKIQQIREGRFKDRQLVAQQQQDMTNADVLKNTAQAAAAVPGQAV